MREHLQHAAGCIAVQLRQRAPQHFDALGRGQAGGRRLTLAVGHGGRNSVNQNAHTAHAEGRARAKAAHRHLQVLRKVLPVANLQAWHAAHQLRQVDQRRRGAKRIDLHRIDRARCIEAALLKPAGADHYFFQRWRGGAFLRLGGWHHQGDGYKCSASLGHAVPSPPCFLMKKSRLGARSKGE